MTSPAPLIFREATLADIPNMQIIRHAVKENVLSDPGLVKDSDYAKYIETEGKGWVCETNGRIIGFAFVNLQSHHVWALFVHPDFEKQGIGRILQHLMLNWYFSQSSITLWLSTAPNTRAEGFYLNLGWTQIGPRDTPEIKFEMKAAIWKKIRHRGQAEPPETFSSH